MKKIGLTGGIGSGKSIISDVIKIIGYPVFNSDKEAKLLMVNNAKVIQEIKKVFGEEAYEGNTLNRPFLASKIFNNENLKSLLNKIVHPEVREAFDKWSKRQKSNIVFNEAAILFETGAYKTLAHTVLVVAEKEKRISRVTSRDKTTIEEVKQRMQNQWKDEAKEELAFCVINNNGIKLVTPQVISMLKKLEDTI